MILTGPEILRQMEAGTIKIDPFDPTLINPNSYNLRLHQDLMVYVDSTLDMRKRHEIVKVPIPPEGLLLEPGRLYLGRTVEHTETFKYVPMLEGRSSVGRLGLFVHATAGFGDVGFRGFWTLEMSCVHPVRIYAGVEICQIFYHSIEGEAMEYRSDKYQNNKGIQPSMLYKDFEKSESAKA